VHPEQPQLPGFTEQPQVDLPVLVPVSDVGLDPQLDEVSHHQLDVPLVGGEQVVHAQQLQW
jgi:hypothetical protein